MRSSHALSTRGRIHPDPDAEPGPDLDPGCYPQRGIKSDPIFNPGQVRSSHGCSTTVSPRWRGCSRGTACCRSTTVRSPPPRARRRPSAAAWATSTSWSSAPTRTRHSTGACPESCHTTLLVYEGARVRVRALCRAGRGRALAHPDHLPHLYRRHLETEQGAGATEASAAEAMRTLRGWFAEALL